jgi:hypothetical protein
MPSGWTRKRGSTWTWYVEDVLASSGVHDC